MSTKLKTAERQGRPSIQSQRQATLVQLERRYGGFKPTGCWSRVNGKRLVVIFEGRDTGSVSHFFAPGPPCMASFVPAPVPVAS